MRRDGGLFVVFEGIDGAGKGTQQSAVWKWEGLKSYHVGLASEPNDQSSQIGKHIRQILRGKLPAPDPFTFQRMYVIDRAQTVVCFLRPLLVRGHIALWERFAHSTIAYGMLSGRDPEEFVKLHYDILGEFMLWPHVTFLLDVSPEIALHRVARGRDMPPELFERTEQLEQIRANYLELARRQEELGIGRIIVVNGMRPAAEVTAEITGILEQGFGL